MKRIFCLKIAILSWHITSRTILEVKYINDHSDSFERFLQYCHDTKFPSIIVGIWHKFVSRWL